MSAALTQVWLERALIAAEPVDGVLATIEDGRFTEVLLGQDPPPGVRQLQGLAVPGLANTHSHAFHRGLRGRTQREQGSFWTWREQMYHLAERLDPDSYLALARATYREMTLAGITAVGEFHYLHHRPDGRPYANPNAMGEALIAAAREAGLRITLLDTCYLSSGFGEPPQGAQVRYDDGSAQAWAERVGALAETVAGRRDDGVRVGAAVHSVRAVPADQLATVAEWAEQRQAPLHVHLSEQVAENDACLAATGLTPTTLLDHHGVLGPRTSVVHATHLRDADIELLGSRRCYASFCPTTERDLGDGLGPASRLREAGVGLTLGSDSHAVIDPFEEMRALELDERLARQTRGHFTARDLLASGTRWGHSSLGFEHAGSISVEQRADLVVIDPHSPRTAGTGRDAHTVVYAASPADVTAVMIDGRLVHTPEDISETRRSVGHDLAAIVDDLAAKE